MEKMGRKRSASLDGRREEVLRRFLEVVGVYIHNYSRCIENSDFIMKF